MLATPDLVHVCDIDVTVGPIRELGAMPRGRRRLVPILGGRVSGPRLEGCVLPGGADWQIARADGILELVARYAIKTTAGPEIAVTNRGLRRAAPELMERLARGEPVDPALVYFRAVPTFEAPAGDFDWLNRSLFLASAARLPDKVSLRIFEVN
ncbi:MAG TPA: DUF3237 domain-containing protein [Hyphomicrobiaceae bacterium]|jgi:hypothetical protein|nr:DUF3237 domain-containing protein [Hyphomicrobiaceae bacterium]